MALRPTLHIKLKSELSDYIINDDQVILVPGVSSWGDVPFQWYYYDGSSTLTPDGDEVIKPTAIVDEGRYIKMHNTQDRADWTASSGITQILNKPSLSTVASSGAYSDLSGKTTLATVAGTGNYNDLSSKPTFKKQETFSGTTNASGIYSVAFGTAYSVAPNISVTPINGNNKETQVVTVSTTGFTVYVQLRSDVIGLLPTYSNVSGRSIDVIITEK